MTEETAAQVEQPVVAPVAAPEANPGEHEPESPNTENQPEGWDRVDFQNDDRTKIEKRFHRLYGQVKRQDQLLSQLVEDNRRLMERQTNWEVGQAQASTAARLAELQDGWKQAFERGDANRAWAIQQEMIDLRARQNRVPEPPRREAPQQTAPQLAQEEAVVIAEWAQDRPFAKDGSEWQQWTATQLQELYVHPKWKDAPIEDKLEEVDRRYKAQVKPQSAAVLDGKGGSRPRQTGPKLSEAQQAVARRLFPKVSPQEAYSRYAKGMA